MSIVYALIAALNVEPPLVTTADLYGTNYIARKVRFAGEVKDVFRDEVDPRILFLIMKDDGGQVYAALNAGDNRTPFAEELIGSRVMVNGECRPTNEGEVRFFLNRELSIYHTNDIMIVSRPSRRPFDVPELPEFVDLPPERLLEMGRRCLTGRVIAVRHSGDLLLETRGRSILRIELRESDPPRPGDTVEIEGDVETDLHHLNLTRAIWRPAELVMPEPLPTTNVAVRGLFVDKTGRTEIKRHFHGRSIRISGILRSLPVENTKGNTFYVESDGVIIPVECGHSLKILPNMEIGCTVQITGICWMNIDNWRPNAVFPRFKHLKLILQNTEDVVVLARPPWWTPGRLLSVIGALMALLLGLLGWNWSLRRIAERRGHQFFREQVARIEAELRTNERSRLAVELHDAISQVLTGVALKIKAAQAMARTNLDKTLASLEIAETALRSSREELRYCLWDLRNNILDVPDFEEAIRRTLKPQTGDIGLLVRFPVSRRALSDNTAQAILRIVRELAVNAIRHGAATSIKVAGSRDERGIHFSVTDNGCGFDPENHVGILQGHYGLQGIQERLDRLNGQMTIESAPGKGTRIVCRISREDGEEHHV